MTIDISPVDSFDRGLESIRSTVRERMPFTFIAYRSLIPEKDDDWYYLAQKVAWFVLIVFNVVGYAIKSVSPIFILIPFVPFIFDAIWIASRSHKSSKQPIPFESHRWFKSIQVIGFVAFSAIGIALLFEKVRP